MVYTLVGFHPELVFLALTLPVWREDTKRLFFPGVHELTRGRQERAQERPANGRTRSTAYGTREFQR